MNDKKYDKILTKPFGFFLVKNNIKSEKIAKIIHFNQIHKLIIFIVSIN